MKVWALIAHHLNSDSEIIRLYKTHVKADTVKCILEADINNNQCQFEIKEYEVK